MPRVHCTMSSAVASFSILVASCCSSLVNLPLAIFLSKSPSYRSRRRRRGAMKPGHDHGFVRRRKSMSAASNMNCHQSLARLWTGCAGRLHPVKPTQHRITSTNQHQYKRGHQEQHVAPRVLGGGRLRTAVGNGPKTMSESPYRCRNRARFASQADCSPKPSRLRYCRLFT